MVKKITALESLALSFSKNYIASIPNNPIAVSFRSILWNLSSIPANVV
jgi:hypothetical protein